MVVRFIAGIVLKVAVGFVVGVIALQALQVDFHRSYRYVDFQIVLVEVREAKVLQLVVADLHVEVSFRFPGELMLEVQFLRAFFLVVCQLQVEVVSVGKKCSFAMVQRL